MRYLMILLSILLWAPALAVRFFLTAVGLLIVPLTSSSNPVFGNNEHPEPPRWYEPRVGEMVGAPIVTFILWWLILGWWFGTELPVGFALVSALHVAFGVLQDNPDYLWRAFRNPTNNLRYLMEEPPITVDHFIGYPNPDASVRDRTNYVDSAWRFARAGLFSEFWYLRYVPSRDRYFEFRVGWKFSGVEGFAPTIQARFGST